MFWPVAIMLGILVVVTALLAVAERLLINYGECKVKVLKDDEEREFTVQGGGYLLHALVENGINVAASCGGKAACGYCKVRVAEGGGPILPTEEVFMSREERQSNTRLACQVKVKNDISVAIPDFLEVVRNIVKNKMYDPRMDWTFNMLTPRLKHELDSKRVVPFTQEDEAATHGIIEASQGNQAALVPVLQEINHKFNYLPKSVFPLVADKLHVPVSLVYRTATFYNAFSLVPRGKNMISVCLGTACHVKGAQNVLSAIERELDIKAGGTTDDMLFSLEGVRCIGCCGLAPVLTVGEDVHGLMTVKKVNKLVEQYKGVEANAEAVS